MLFTFRENVDIFLLCGPILTKKKNNRKKSKIKHFEKQEKNIGLEIW